jgi:hypothetical protein
VKELNGISIPFNSFFEFGPFFERYSLWFYFAQISYWEDDMRVSKRTFGILFILVGIILLIAFVVFHLQIILLLEIYISPDGNITLDGQRQLDYVIYVVVALLIILGYGLVKAEDDVWRRRIHQIFLSNPYSTNSKLRITPKTNLIVTTLIGLFLIVHIRLYEPSSQLFAVLYLEDGIFESLTPMLLVASIIFIGMSISRLWRDQQLFKYRNLFTLIYFGLILFFFLNAMEEISWGQRIIGWDTPQTFAGNVQEETNLHNYFNQYYLLFYRLLVLFPIFVFISIWLEWKQRYLVFNRLVLPHASLIGLSILIAIVSLIWYKEQELLEEMFAVFFLFYSLWIYQCYRVSGYFETIDNDQVFRQLDSTGPTS